METRAEIREKHGIRMLEHPDIANKELTEKEANEYEHYMVSLHNFHEEIDKNIEEFCSRCRYYQTEESDKCDSWIHGCSYGVSCKYIGKAKGEDMSHYENRRKIDL